MPCREVTQFLSTCVQDGTLPEPTPGFLVTVAVSDTNWTIALPVCVANKTNWRNALKTTAPS